ncbi:phenylalanine--tRNA ligase subunit beta [Nannocystis pusilla]|uniref:phenylalanine--tRNA ligase subunit beta n=1 Tax=Nannocystis pusilla TaxID=889268 RepID=UPI003BF0FF52
MKISHQWLSEMFAEGALEAALAAWSAEGKAAAYTRLLTGLGLEVEAVHAVGEGVRSIVVGEIRGKSPHPKADKLTVVELFDGTGVVQVVCGASNLPPLGGKVAFAPVGAVLPGGLAIAARELRGVPSQGMICSEAELEIGADDSGILVLPEDWRAGDRLVDRVPGIVDTVLELGVTPNRPDALGHVGVARDVGTKLGLPLRPPHVNRPEAANTPGLVTIAAPELCGRYLGYVLEGMSVQPSPLWMRVRLHRVGLRAISNVVDVTNFVLMECGQPLHAFDRDRLAESRVVVRRAERDEPMTTLDGTQKLLTTDDLVIADAGAPQALAGVMGGAQSMVHAGTHHLLLEAAWFAPPGIRATARRHGYATDSSYRFERGVDHGVGLERAALRALGLLLELAGGRCTAWTDAAGERPQQPTIPLRLPRVTALLGVEVPADTARAVLGGLEVQVREDSPEAWTCVAPTHRPDLRREVDLIEELMRFHGLDKVPARLTVPAEARAAAHSDPITELGDRLAEGLRDAGLHEHVAMAFVAESKIEFFTVPPERRVRVENPMRAAGVMRTHMLPGLLDALAHNVARHTRPVRLFEVGRTYAWPERPVPKDGPTAAIDVLLPRERAVAAALIYGGAKGGASAREITGAAVQALARVGLRARPVDPPAPAAHLHPGVQAALAVDGAVVGEAGEVHPDLVRAWDLPEETRVYYAEIDIEAVPPRVTATARDLPRFPSTARDLSLEIPLTLSAARVVAALTAAAGQVHRTAIEASERASGKTTAGEVRLATDSFGEPAVEVLEDYRGAGVPVGHRALLLRLHYAAEQRSVTDDEAQALHNAIVAAACESLRASAPTVRPR